MFDKESVAVSEGKKKTTLYCSFCGKSQHEVRALIAGPTVFICDECIVACLEALLKKTSFAPTGSMKIYVAAKELEEELATAPETIDGLRERDKVMREVEKVLGEMFSRD